MIIRVGIPASFRRLAAVARAIDAPILISANAFWRRSRFVVPRDDPFTGSDVALDSAGFVAMALYGGYRWSLADYVGFAGRMRPTWWAAPDFCCEPEIAHNRDAVLERVHKTAAELLRAEGMARDHGIVPPMPVLQGWAPDDYRLCADIMRDLPALVGVGSVCRRALAGEAGILNVIRGLDRHLPSHVRLHLFGVKGAAVGALTGHPRIASIDSAAWDAAARRERKTGRDLEFRAGHLRAWYSRQRASLGLFRP